VGYQGRRASKTTNSLFIADNSGQIIAMSMPQNGSHHDLFEIEKAFKEMIDQLENAGIDTRGIFLNADAVGLIRSNFEESGPRRKLRLTLKLILEIVKKTI